MVSPIQENDIVHGENRVALPLHELGQQIQFMKDAVTDNGKLYLFVPGDCLHFYFSCGNDAVFTVQIQRIDRMVEMKKTQ